MLHADTKREEDELITFNLRGTLITVNRRCADTIPGSRLWRAVRREEPNPIRDECNRSYFNRNPSTFQEVLDCLANDGEALFSPHDDVQRRRLALELSFWGVNRKRERETVEPQAPRNYGSLEVILPRK